MKVKNDHRRRSRVRIPLKPWYFQASSSQLLKLENLLRWSFFTFIKWKYKQIVYANIKTTSKFSKTVHVNAKILRENIELKQTFPSGGSSTFYFSPFFRQNKLLFRDDTARHVFWGALIPFQAIDRMLLLLIQALLHNKLISHHLF